jgi:hypothetical protein
MIESLEGTLAQSAVRCTHLVMDKMTRTAKLMAAISTCQHIVTSQWIRDSAQQKQWAGMKWMKLVGFRLLLLLLLSWC